MKRMKRIGWVPCPMEGPYALNPYTTFLWINKKDCGKYFRTMQPGVEFEIVPVWAEEPNE